MLVSDLLNNTEVNHIEYNYKTSFYQIVKVNNTLLSNYTGNLQNDTLVKGTYKVFNPTNDTLMLYIQENNVNNNQLIKIFNRNVLN